MKDAKRNLKNLTKIADKVKTKISTLLLKEYKALEKAGKHIVDIDENDKTISMEYLNRHVLNRLKKGDIAINVADYKKGRFQIVLPHIETTEFDHLYILPAIREKVLKKITKDEIKTIEAMELLRMRDEELHNLDIAKRFSYSGLSTAPHLKKIEEIDKQLEELL